jgi:hypothetical protein
MDETENKERAGHTAGPWTVGGDGADVFGPGTPPNYTDSKHIADCQTDSPGLLEMRSVDCANARLIAAAPELLEALLEIRDMVLDDENPDANAMKGLAIAAIAKATGAA